MVMATPAAGPARTDRAIAAAIDDGTLSMSVWRSGRNGWRLGCRVKAAGAQRRRRQLPAPECRLVVRLGRHQRQTRKRACRLPALAIKLAALYDVGMVTFLDADASTGQHADGDSLRDPGVDPRACADTARLLTTDLHLAHGVVQGIAAPA
jgi:hypothetical protein